MSRVRASVTQADIARAVRAAKQAGASNVEVRIDGRATIVIKLSPSIAPSLDAHTPANHDEEIVI